MYIQLDLECKKAWCWFSLFFFLSVFLSVSLYFSVFLTLSLSLPLSLSPSVTAMQLDILALLVLSMITPLLNQTTLFFKVRSNISCTSIMLFDYLFPMSSTWNINKELDPFHIPGNDLFYCINDSLRLCFNLYVHGIAFMFRAQYRYSGISELKSTIPKMRNDSMQNTELCMYPLSTEPNVHKIHFPLRYRQASIHTDRERRRKKVDSEISS